MAGDWPGGAEERFDALSRMLVSIEASREATMSRIAELACELLARCDFVSLSLVERAHVETVGATDDRALDLDRAQYRSGLGPCLDAMRQQRVVREGSLPDAAARWGEPVAKAASELGIGSSVSAPLVVDGVCIGGLNLYATHGEAFDETDEAVLSAFADRAAPVAANARDYWAMVETTRQLENALQARAVIEQAKGMLMARQGCSADEAFDMLRRASQRKNRKLRDIVTDIVQRTSGNQRDDDA